jgi:hypothetical protein
VITSGQRKRRSDRLGNRNQVSQSGREDTHIAGENGTHIAGENGANLRPSLILSCYN